MGEEKKVPNAAKARAEQMKPYREAEAQKAAEESRAKLCEHCAKKHGCCCKKNQPK